jgi:general stress protein YciG
MRKNPHAVALGRMGGKARAEALTPEELANIGKKGGKKGGKARAQALTPEQRSEISRKAAAARWAKRKGQ